MWLKLNSCHVQSKHIILLSLFAVSVWTYYIYYTNGFSTAIPVPIPLSALSEENVTENFSSTWVNDQAVIEDVESPQDLKPQNENQSILTNHRDSDQMACHLPKLNPFDATIKQYMDEPQPATVNCDTDHPLIFQTDLNSTLIQVKNPGDYGYFNCCYKEFKRMDVDYQVIESEDCVTVTNITTIPSQYEFITVYCTKLNGSTEVTVPVDMFNFVPLKPEVEQRVQEWENRTASQERRVNVVILGIDSVSHMNFKRVMPKTLKYINEKLNAIGMGGFTKVEDNTFPNVVPVLAGMTVEQLKTVCWQQEDKHFDSCPFIWKNYSANGYRTASTEDAVWMSAFNYQKRGFLKPPTDYYNGAFTHRLEAMLGHYPLTNCKMCYGPRIGFQTSLDNLKAMGIRMGSERRYFQFSWTTSLTHDYLNLGKLGDEPLLDTMKWFYGDQQLENTVFILMSDHGLRWGGIRTTIQGMIEDRMPFLYFILPEWFKEKYRPAVSNLIRNKERLTTAFDLHETLLDLLHVENIEETNLNKRYESLLEPELPRGISLFLPVPTRRTCKDAEIDEHWCVCQTSVTLEDPNVPIIRKAAVEVVDAINKMFTDFPQCTSLTLDAVLNAQVMQTDNKEMNNSLALVTSVDDDRLKSQQFTCSVSFSVLPSNATFEATITRHTGGEWELSGSPSRTNLYGTQSHCVTDYNMKKYCYCK